MHLAGPPQARPQAPLRHTACMPGQAPTSRAALTARSTSSAVASATLISTSPERGSTVSNVPPSDESTNCPPISSCAASQAMPRSDLLNHRGVEREGQQSPRMHMGLGLEAFQ